MPEKITFHVKMDPELRDQLKEKAKREGRTITWLIENAVKSHYGTELEK